MKTDLSKIAVVIIADKNGKMMQRFSPNSYMTQGSVMTIRSEYEDVANGADTRTESALPIQSVMFSVCKMKGRGFCPYEKPEGCTLELGECINQTEI